MRVGAVVEGVTCGLVRVHCARLRGWREQGSVLELGLYAANDRPAMIQQLSIRGHRPRTSSKRKKQRPRYWTRPHLRLSHAYLCVKSFKAMAAVATAELIPTNWLKVKPNQGQETGRVHQRGL